MFHDHLKRIRKTAKKTQAELANYLNVSAQSISKWEKGESMPSVEVLCELANFYGVTLDQLTNENIEINSISSFEQPNEQPNAQASGQPTAHIITTLNFLFNYINKEDEKISRVELEDLQEIGLDGDEKHGIVGILKRLDVFVPNEIIKYLSDEQLLEYKIKYWAVKEIYISPHKALLKEIDKAILAANIGLTPTNDGKVIRLVFPVLTEERRKELAKQIKKMGEDSKVAIRNIRRDGMESIKKAKNAKEITEDDAASLEKEVEKLTAKGVESVDKAAQEKEKDVMSV